MIDLKVLAGLSEAEILEHAKKDPKWFRELAASFAAGAAARDIAAFPRESQ